MQLTKLPEVFEYQGKSILMLGVFFNSMEGFCTHYPTAHPRASIGARNYPQKMPIAEPIGPSHFSAEADGIVVHGIYLHNNAIYLIADKRHVPPEKRLSQGEASLVFLALQKVARLRGATIFRWEKSKACFSKVWTKTTCEARKYTEDSEW